MKRVVLEARSAKEGGTLNFLGEVFPRLAERLRARGAEVTTMPGPPRSFGERFQRRRALFRADTIFHTGNRSTFAPRARRVVLMRDRSLLPGSVPRARITPRRLVRRILARHAVNFADVLVVPSASMVEPVKKVKLGGPPEIHVIPYGRPSWKTPHSRELASPPRALAIGLLSWHKNFPLLAEVMRRADRAGMPRFLLTITARSDETMAGAALGRAIADLGDRVQLIGPQPRSALEGLYAEHDLFLMPSHIESFGQPLVEAMTMGMPIVASDRPWAREIAGEAAFYADPLDAESWLSPLAAIFDRGKRENLAGLERSKNFDWDRTVDGYVQLLMGSEH